jgi:hypothetical protein
MVGYNVERNRDLGNGRADLVSNRLQGGEINAVHTCGVLGEHFPQITFAPSPKAVTY